MIDHNMGRRPVSPSELDALQVHHDPAPLAALLANDDLRESPRVLGRARP